MEKVKSLFQKHPILISVCYCCVYFPIFALLEMYRQPEYFVHCWLDDVIPFNEYFIIPYVMWFAFVPGMLIFFLRRSRADYIKCCKIIYGGMSICLLIYWMFPTGLMLREPVENTNIFAVCVNLLRGLDTPTNVCPSIHVSSTVGICLVLFRSRELARYKKLKLFAAVLGVLICLSTMLLDQHSAIDVLCGFALSFVLCAFVEQTDAGEAYEVRKGLIH